MKRATRIFSITLVLIMLISAVSAITVSAAEPAVRIFTADDFLKISENPKGTYVLFEDIDLKDAEYNAAVIPSLLGTLDGNGHTVKGLNIVSTDTTAGLIGTNNGTVRSLTVKGKISVTGPSATAYIGGIAAKNNVLIKNCISEVDITVQTTETAYIGGIAGTNASSYSSDSITDCENKGNIKVENPEEETLKNVYIGGITSKNGNIVNCNNYGSITANCPNLSEINAAGISANESQVKYAINYGDVKVGASTVARAGGIVGFIGSGTRIYIQYCENKGNVSAELSNLIQGEEMTTDIENSYPCAGGIAAYMANATVAATAVVDGNCFSTVRNCLNTGNVTSKVPDGALNSSYAGGIAGIVNGLVYNCLDVHAGTITAKVTGPIYATVNPAGKLRGKVKNTYYKNSAEVYNTVIGTPATESSTVALDATALTLQSSYLTPSASGDATKNFDFKEKWILVEGMEYPILNITSRHIHFYIAKYILPTCYQDGYTVYTCSCKDTYSVTDTGTATGNHLWGTYVSDENADCIHDGTKTAHCTTEGCPATDTVTDAGTKTGIHSFVTYVSDNNASCWKDGTKTATCSVDGCTATDTVADTGSATGNHSWGTYTSNNDATCWKDGTKTAHCTIEGCTAENTVTDTGTKTNNHIWGTYTSDNNADCIHDGTKTAHCTNAGCTAADTVTDAGTKTGIHSFVTYTYNNDATLEKDGTETAHCSVNGCTATDTRTKPGTKISITDTSKMFTDVKAGEWYKEYIDYAVTYNMMSGVGNGLMKPNNDITRAQFVQILANIEGVDTKSTAALNIATKFTDVPKGQWFTPAVKWANDNKLVDGTSATTFNPNGKLTREAMCKILIGYTEFKKISLQNVNAKASFKDDATISAWAKDFVYKCQMSGLVEGTNGAFNPKKTATRAQVATIMTRLDKTYKIVKK